MSELDAIWVRAEAYVSHGTPGRHAPKDRAVLLAAVNAVTALAESWHTQGEYDMSVAKEIPDEDAAIAVYLNGVNMVENARHIRTALTAALGGGA